MRILLLIGGFLGVSTMAMANSPEIPIANQPTVHHQANVNCCDHVYIVYRDTNVRTPVATSAQPPVMYQTSRPVQYQTSRPVQYQAAPPVQNEAAPRVNYGSTSRMRPSVRIDSSRFPRFQSWTSM